jgi:DNA polymerase-3 subunit beta
MIRFSKDSLREALTGLRVLKLGKHVLSALHCVRVTGCDTLLHFERTDLDQVLRYECVAVSDAWTQLLVPYELLVSAAKQADAGSELVLTGGPSPTLAYKVAGLPVTLPFDATDVAEYPPTPTAEGDVIRLPEGVLSAMKEALCCASTDSSRYLLNSVLLDAHAVVATDGKQLYRRNSLDLPIREGGAIFPNSAVLDVLPDADADLWIWTTTSDRSFAQISVGPWRWTTKLIDGNFPNYRQVIPKIEDYPALVHLGEVDVTRIKTVLPKLPGFKEHNSPIVLRIDSDGASLHTAPGRPKVHVALEHSDIVCKEPVRIGFNARFLLSALETQSRELRVRDPRSPIMLTGYSRMQLWMPVQIEEPQPVPVSPVEPAESAPSDPSSESPTPVVPVSESTPVSETQPVSEIETQTHNPNTTMVATVTTNNAQPVSPQREDTASGAVASRIPAAPAQPVTVVDAINQRLARLRDLLREAGNEFANIQALVKEQQRSYRVLERDHEALKKNIRALREVNV